MSSSGAAGLQLWRRAAAAQPPGNPIRWIAQRPVVREQQVKWRANRRKRGAACGRANYTSLLSANATSILHSQRTSSERGAVRRRTTRRMKPGRTIHQGHSFPMLRLCDVYSNVSTHHRHLSRAIHADRRANTHTRTLEHARTPPLVVDESKQKGGKRPPKTHFTRIHPQKHHTHTRARTHGLRVFQGGHRHTFWTRWRRWCGRSAETRSTASEMDSRERYGKRTSPLRPAPSWSRPGAASLWPINLLHTQLLRVRGTAARRWSQRGAPCPGARAAPTRPIPAIMVGHITACPAHTDRRPRPATSRPAARRSGRL